MQNDLRAALRRSAFVFATTLLAALALAPPAGAQPQPDPVPGNQEAQREPGAVPGNEGTQPEPGAVPGNAEPREPGARGRGGDDASALQRAQSELERARRELEEAAREVARLSAEAVGPYVDELRRDWFDTRQRATLGISIEDADIGVRVTAVSPGGPADEAGIRTGDVITAIDGAALAAEPPAPAGESSPSRLLIAELANVTPGERVVLRVVRDNEPRDVTVETSERPLFTFDRPFSFDMPPMPRPPAAPFFGGFRAFGRWQDMELVTLTPELGEYFGTDEGLLVVRAPDDDALPLRDGDVILAIGDRMPTSPEHALRILASFEPGETLRLTIMRRQMRETLEVQLPAEADGAGGRGRPGVRGPGRADEADRPGGGQRASLPGGVSVV